MLHAAAGPMVSGRLLGEDGMPILGTVALSHHEYKCYPSPSGGIGQCYPTVYLDYSAKTDAEGRFTIGPLEAYQYVVGASAEGFLNTGTWGTADGHARTVDVSNGNSAPEFTIRLRRAAQLLIHVNDPNNLYFVPCGSPLICTNLSIGAAFVSSSGFAYYGAGLGVRTADGGYDYGVAIPFDVPMALWVSSYEYIMTDASGNTLNATGVIDRFIIPQDMCTERFVLNITARIGAAAP